MTVQTEQYARYVAELTWAEVEQEPQRLARRSLLDWMGVAVAGLHEPGAQLLAGSLRGGGDPPRDAASVALLLGTAGYASEFEQTHVPSISHLSTVLWPAVFDWLWTGRPTGAGADGREWLTAFIAGFEVAAHLGRALAPPLYQRGWHPTPLFGAVGAAAAVARCAGAGAGTIATAMGMASALIGGAQASFGTHAVALGAGYAAHLGRLAGSLACSGFEGPHGLAESPGHALRNMLYPDAPLLPAFAAGLPEELRWNGFKAYPSALFTHAAIECALHLRRELPAAELAQIEIILSPDALPRVDRPDWAGAEAARYSVQFNVRQAWVTGKVTMADFMEDAVRAARDTPFARMIIRSDPAMPRFGARVAATSSAGHRHYAEVPVPAGFPERPLTDPDLLAKFLSCAGPHVGPDAAARLGEVVLDGGIVQVAQATRQFRSWVEEILAKGLHT